MPATGVRPPVRTLVAVRAIAPVAGMPPKNGATMLAMPCAISSWFGSWRSSIMRVGHARGQQRLDRAEQRDRDRRRERGCAASTARVRPARTPGSPCGMPPKRVPIVSTSRFSTPTTSDATTSTTIGPGRRVITRRPRRVVLAKARSRSGIVAIAGRRPRLAIAGFRLERLAGRRDRLGPEPGAPGRHATPAATVTGSTRSRLAAIARIRAKNSSGIVTSRPRKSFSCDSRISTAMPLVKPITIDTGMKRIRPPSRSAPIAKSSTPAATVQTIRFATPYCATMP